MMTTGILLVTLGGPRTPEEIPGFIRNFIGRELPPPAMKAVVERYEQIGGSSPLVRITGEQALALGAALGPGYLCAPAFRYARPSIEEALDAMAEARPMRILMLLLSPFYAGVTTGNYIERAKEHLEKRPLSIPVGFVHSWFREPLFIESWVEKIKEDPLHGEAFTLFSAHSLPDRDSNEPYRRQIEETVGMIVARCGIKDYALGWQSIPNNVREPWITPTVEERIDDIAADGFGSVVQVPVGFTADHIETLYDIDITHHNYAREKGLSFRRLSSLNAGDTFIGALKEVVLKFMSAT
jgi:ferrochelatase